MRLWWGLVAAGATMSAPGAGELTWLEVTPYPGWTGPRAQSSGLHSETFRAVRSEKEWSTLWQLLAQNRPSDAAHDTEPPQVDFTKFTILVAALGTRATGGYTVSIQYAYDDGAVIHASVLEVRPGPNCTVGLAFTYPIVIALIPRRDRTVRFELETAAVDCSSVRAIVSG
jgi:PrcB C-terminal